MKTKSIQNNAKMGSDNANNSYDNSSSTNYSSNYKPGSMMAKANMVKEFNEKNNRE